MAGRGLVTSPGVGRLITMGAGCITTASGSGCRAVTSTRSEAGGDLRSLRLSILVFHSATIFAGIRCRTTSAIRIHDIIDVTIQITAAADAMDVTPAGGVMAAMGVTGVMVAMDATAAMAGDVRVSVERAVTVARLTVRRGRA